MGGLTISLSNMEMFIVVKTFPKLQSLMHDSGVYGLYSAACFCSVLHVYFCIPETKDTNINMREEWHFVILCKCIMYTSINQKHFDGLVLYEYQFQVLLDLSMLKINLHFIAFSTNSSLEMSPSPSSSTASITSNTQAARRSWSSSMPASLKREEFSRQWQWGAGLGSPEETHHDAGDLVRVHCAAPIRVIRIKHPAKLGLGGVKILDTVRLQESINADISLFIYVYIPERIPRSPDYHFHLHQRLWITPQRGMSRP